jgi:hypothetical protein
VLFAHGCDVIEFAGPTLGEGANVIELYGIFFGDLMARSETGPSISFQDRRFLVLIKLPPQSDSQVNSSDTGTYIVAQFRF